MPFLDSKIIRPLYDILKGGPPEAYKCIVSEPAMKSGQAEFEITDKECGELFKTVGGVTAHIEKVHAMKIQLEIFQDAKPTRLTE